MKLFFVFFTKSPLFSFFFPNFDTLQEYTLCYQNLNIINHEKKSIIHSDAHAPIGSSGRASHEGIRLPQFRQKDTHILL